MKLQENRIQQNSVALLEEIGEIVTILVGPLNHYHQYKNTNYYSGDCQIQQPVQRMVIHSHYTIKVPRSSLQAGYIL